MHGAGDGAPFGKANGMWKDGSRSRDAMELKRAVEQLLSAAQETADALFP